MERLVRSSAPWSAAFLAFLTGAAMGAGAVPIIFYSASDDLKAVMVVLCGLAATPFGALLGWGVRNRLSP